MVKIDDIIIKINSIASFIKGSKTSALTTTAKTVVEGINELDKDLGDVSTLTTTAKDSVVNSINELDTDKQEKIEAGTSGNIVTYSGTKGTFGTALSKSTDITKDSTATEIPTAKAVYDFRKKAIAVDEVNLTTGITLRYYDGWVQILGFDFTVPVSSTTDMVSLATIPQKYRPKHEVSGISAYNWGQEFYSLVWTNEQGALSIFDNKGRKDGMRLNLVYPLEA